jgi:hypothetical protein
MKFIKREAIKGNSNYFSFWFTHRVSGKLNEINVTAANLQSAYNKAWVEIRNLYKANRK